MSAPAQPTGYLVLQAFKGSEDWQIIAGYENKPDAIAMRQHRQAAGPARRLRLVAESEWPLVGGGV